MPFAQRPSEARSSRVPRAAPVAFESLENRTLFSGTAVDVIDTTASTGSTVDAAAATDAKTNNGGGWHLHKNGEFHFHGKFQWV